MGQSRCGLEDAQAGDSAQAVPASWSPWLVSVSRWPLLYPTLGARSFPRQSVQSRQSPSTVLFKQGNPYTELKSDTYEHQYSRWCALPNSSMSNYTKQGTCSYKSSNFLRGSLSWATCGKTASQRPLFMSALNVSRLSTVFRDTWHSFCRVWNVCCSEFSLQNCNTILITLHTSHKSSSQDYAYIH